MKPIKLTYQMIVSKWKPALLSTLALTFITSLPQLCLWYERGSNWNGGYANIDMDEFGYSAYLNALIDGRPRRNDPYSGNDEGHAETLFSIQFVPAYALAIPARIFHLSACTMFILLFPLATSVSALTIFQLLTELTGNVRLAAIGCVGVLCLGSVAAVNPLMIFLGRQSYDFLPFVRRYVPSMAFPVFFAMTLFVWRGLTRNLLWSALAGVSLAILVYSYFFLWTAAIAWLCVVYLLWLIFRPRDRKRVLTLAAITSLIATFALIPYAWMLMHRAGTIDRTQILEATHKLDLFRGPEIFGFLVLIVLAYTARTGAVLWKQPNCVFLTSFALSPFVVFNQQVITGRSLQPFHYEYFICNYWVVLAAFIAVGVFWRKMPRRLPLYLMLGSLAMGLMIGVRTTQLTRSTSARVDVARGVALYLKTDGQAGLLFSSSSLLMDVLPTTAVNPVLWSPHMSAFSTLDPIELRKRFYQTLYYRGVSEGSFAELLRSGFSDRVEVFGAERADPALASSAKPISEEEINNAARDYGRFVESFDKNLASAPVISYAVLSAGDDLSKVDRWYKRELLKDFGDFVIYRIRLRNE